MVSLEYPRVDDVIADVERPTAQVKYVDTSDGGVWVTWRWEHALAAPRIWGIPPQAMAGALAAFGPAVPEPSGAESADDALRRAWGVWGDVEREKRIAWALACALIPHALGEELNRFIAAGRRPHLRIQPSRALAAVPWQALRVDEGERVVHNADVSTLLPVSICHSARREATPWLPGASVVAAIDPPVPGRLPGLGRVLRAEEPIVEEAFAALGDRLVGAPRAALSRTQLRERIDGAGRLVYVGHVSAGEYGLDTRMHLSDGPESSGRAELVSGLHRPLTAGDIALGDDWRMPARVALIGCASGGEATYADPTGLVAAVTMRGASIVTAARWRLPTDVGLEWLAAAGLGGSATESSAPFHAFARAVAAVERAHEADDPVAALSAWQRAEADAWERTGDPAHTPLVWGALTTAVS